VRESEVEQRGAARTNPFANGQIRSLSSNEASNMSKKSTRQHWEEDVEEGYSLRSASAPHRHQAGHQSSKMVVVRRSPNSRLTQTYQPPGPELILMRSMEQWGIDEKRNSSHSAFCKLYTDSLRRCLIGNSDKAVNMEPVILPQDPLESIRLVLQQEIELVSHYTSFTKVKDKLPKQCIGPPYAFNYDTRSLERRPVFREFEASQLDPLLRFKSQTVLVEDYFRDNWRDFEGYKAAVFRAHVGRIACSTDVACANCNKPDIRWNLSKGDHPHWTKLVCSNCNSTYEIKTTGKQQGLQYQLEAGKVNNTSFLEQYYHLCKKYPEAKRYVVLVCTEGEPPFQVHVGEVKRIEPWLKDKSFLNDQIRIYSRAILSKHKKWFGIPSGVHHDETNHQAVHSLVEEVLKQNFSSFNEEEETSYYLWDMSLEDLRQCCRDLKRKRSRIISLEKKHKAELSDEDKELVETKDQVWRDLAEAESHLKERLGEVI